MASKIKTIPQEDRDELRCILELNQSHQCDHSLVSTALVLALLETYEGVLGLIAYLEEGGVGR